MGLMDTVKGWFGKTDDIAKVKDQADTLVDSNRDKIPDSAEKVIDQVSDAADKVIPGDSTPT